MVSDTFRSPATLNNLPRTEANVYWSALSARLAAGASGRVPAYVTYASTKSIYFNIERGILQQNAMVTELIENEFYQSVGGARYVH